MCCSIHSKGCKLGTRLVLVMNMPLAAGPSCGTICVFCVSISITAQKSHSAVYCIALYYPALHSTVLHFAALHSAAFHCTLLYTTALHYTALSSSPLHSTLLHSTPLKYTALHSTPLCSTPTYPTLHHPLHYISLH